MSNAVLHLDPCGQHNPQASYWPRSPRNTEYHKLVEDNYEELERIWDSVYQRMYGYWRPHIVDVIYKYLDCGDPHLGLARVMCADCNTEYLLSFSCKCRGFCHKVKPGAAIAVQTFGELVNFNPYLHIIASGWSFRCASLLTYATKIMLVSAKIPHTIPLYNKKQVPIHGRSAP